MTDSEIEQAIKDEKIVLDLYLMMGTVLALFVTISSMTTQNYDTLSIMPFALLLPIIQMFAVLASKTEKRIREMTGKWNLKAS